MTDIFSPTVIIAVVVAIVIGAGIGVGLLLMIQRSQSGGKSLADLRQEKEAYQNEVDAHFEKTGQLFKEMTENYRTLYEHMATGAQQLCQGEPVIKPLDLPKPDTKPQLAKDAAPAEPTAATAAEGDASAKTATAEKPPEHKPEANKPAKDKPAEQSKTAASGQHPEASASGSTARKTAASPQDVLKSSRPEPARKPS